MKKIEEWLDRFNRKLTIKIAIDIMGRVQWLASKIHDVEVIKMAQIADEYKEKLKAELADMEIES